MKRKLLAAVLATVMALSAAACGGGSGDGGSGDGGSGNGGSGNGGSGDGVSFTIFNSKSEIQEFMEAAAEEYSKANGVNIEVYYSQDTVAAHLAQKYAAKEPYTLNMTDAKDIYSLGKEYGYDLSGAEWTKNSDYNISIDGKLLGVPVCVEARGILYNAHAIKEVTGEDFDPESIKTLDDFTAFCDKLVAAGMETPTAILKPDWSLGAHYLMQVYEQREDVQGFIDALHAGTADLASDEKFNSLMDTFDALMKYNTFASSPATVEDDQVHQKMAEGEVAFQFGGCWEWNDLITYDYTGEIGIMPVPQNMTDAYTGCLVGGGSKYWYIDNSEFTTDEQRKAAMDFLEWFYTSDEGKTLVSDTCGMVAAFKDNTVDCTNDLGKSIKPYVDGGKLVPNYDYAPDDHYAKLGASMQKYLAGQTDRAGLAAEIEAYWKATTPVEH